ncbi:hypothetical protein E2C01_056864 [Portunus trituberculatus]|uniref:Uncharacterized protein n=1 Tax=Portunus trituberculatus TaxID=210409 RepID=A0A5B7H1S6_PORTR|nr:hypothetical protein [Portunus trituberculatus]
MPVMTAPSRTAQTRFTANKAHRLTVRDVRLTARTSLVRNNASSAAQIYRVSQSCCQTGEARHPTNLP